MGLDERIFVIREGMPIGYVEYSGSPMTEKLERKYLREVETDIYKGYEEFGVKFTGELLNRILEEFKDYEKNSLEQHLRDYFEKLGVKSNDQVFVTAS